MEEMVWMCCRAGQRLTRIKRRRNPLSEANKTDAMLRWTTTTSRVAYLYFTRIRSTVTNHPTKSKKEKKTTESSVWCVAGLWPTTAVPAPIRLACFQLHYSIYNQLLVIGLLLGLAYVTIRPSSPRTIVKRRRNKSRIIGRQHPVTSEFFSRTRRRVKK